MRHPSWAITESTPGLAVEERKDSGSEVTVFGEMVNGPMPDKLVPATALGNGGQELAGGGGGHFGGFGSLGRLHTKAKETGITRRIVDFVMKHVEKYTEAHATVQNGEDAMNVTTPSIPPRTQDASLLLLQALSLPDIESFLYVRFEAWGAYKRRWCILRDSSLYIVKSPTDLRLVAVLAITSNTDILPDPDASKHLGTGHHRYGFKICPRKTGEEVQETEDEDEEVISALIDSVYANLDEPQRKTPSASPSPAHPVLHLAAEHQLTVVNWIGHLARSARGEKTRRSTNPHPVEKQNR
ncbi:hypothetical protein BC829DRAFT_147777 [Chytridium lagenaria]|nr:hypothetical protein BC829DRAFT_147777 [Chytridium lagenaria]